MTQLLLFTGSSNSLDQSVDINVVSGQYDKERREYLDKNLSGCYKMVEIANEIIAYKISF